MCITDAESRLCEAVTLAKQAPVRSAAGDGVALLFRKPGFAAQEESVLVGGCDVDPKQLAPLGLAEVFLELVVVVSLGNVAVGKVGQRQDVQQRQAVLVDAVGGGHVAGEGLPRQGVGDRNHLAVQIQGLGEISGSLQGRRRGHLLKGAGVFDSQILQRIEAEKPIFLLVELARHINRAAEREAEGVVPVQRLGGAGAVVEEVIGVEHFVALVPVAGAVKLSPAGFRHHLHDGPAVDGILRLVAVEDHLDFADGVHGGDTRENVRSAEVVADHAIHRQDVRIVLIAADHRSSRAVTAADGIGVGGILHARK